MKRLWRAPGKSQEKRLTFFRQNSSIAAQADFLNLYWLGLTIALLDIRIPALQVENPAHVSDIGKLVWLDLLSFQGSEHLGAIIKEFGRTGWHSSQSRQ